MEPDEFETRKIDSLKMSTNNYWLGLLTSNTILVAIFATSAVTNSSNKILVFFLIFLSIICSGLLIKNFRDVKNMDLFAGNLSGEELIANHNEHVQKAVLLRKKIVGREGLVEKLLIIEAVIILVIVAINTFGFTPKEKTKILLNGCSNFYHNN